MAKVWRAPYGEVNDELMSWAAEVGYRYHIDWTRDYARGVNLDSLDWVTDRNDKNYMSSDDIIGKILEFDGGKPGGANGGIILMHLGTRREVDQVHPKIPYMVEEMRKKGYEFVKISELIGVDFTAGEGTDSGGL